MAKSTNNAGKANAKRATATKMKTVKAKSAAKTAARRTTTRTAKRTTQRARQEKAGTMEGHVCAPARRLRPIAQRQSRDEILATVAADCGVERPIVERVARSLATTYTRHLMRNGSGRVEILDLGAALWRGKEGARAARTMFSPLVKREVTVPARRAQAVPRLRVHAALREIVARV